MIKETTTDPSKEHINEKKYKLFLTVFKRGSNKFFTDRRTVTLPRLHSVVREERNLKSAIYI